MNYSKIQHVIFILLSAAAIICHPYAATAKNKEEPLRCITFYTSVKGVNSVIAQAARVIEKELDHNENIVISLYPLDNDAYSSLEYKVDLAVELKMDVLILSGTATNGDSSSFDKLKEENIKLILIDGDVAQSGRCAYVGTDNAKAGEQGAQLLHDWSGRCAVGILSSPVSEYLSFSGSRQERRDGFIEAAADFNNQSPGAFEIAADLTCPLELADAISVIEEMLKENPQINALFCLDSASGIAAAQTLELLNKAEEVYVICFDMPAQVEDALAKGGIDAAIIQDVTQCGRLCAGILEEIQNDPGSVTDHKEMVECKVVTIP